MKRSFVTRCPSCGAEVRFDSGDSVLAVCGYCTSTLLRSGDVLENLGKMAELFDDHSPLALGAQGSHGGRGFGLVGRLQVRYPDGVWNEWRLLHDDGTAGWLSEDNGQYVLLDDGDADPVPGGTDRAAADAPPPFEALKLDEVVPIGAVAFRVVNKETAAVVAAAGELPFAVVPEAPVRVVDLRGPNGEFATLDYPTEGAPRRYRGVAVALPALRLSGLRTEAVREVEAQAFACPACGAPVQAALPTTRTIACAACGSVVDLTQGTGRQMAFWRQADRPTLLLPLATTGRLDDIDWTVVGYQQRRGEVDGDAFVWDEYLLHAPLHGFRFLIHDAGHWTWTRTLQRAIRRMNGRDGRGFVPLDGTRYELFGRYRSTVTRVAGEFYWRVRRDDQTAHEDYIAPPAMLSCEITDREITWSQGHYLTGAAVAAAFRLPRPLPAPTSIGMIQPAPRGWRRAHVALAAVVLGALLLLQAGLFVAGRSGTLVESTPLAFGGGRDHLLEIGGSREANLIVRTEANLENQAIMVHVDVAARAPVVQSGAPSLLQRQGSRELGFWEGRDSDGYWSEGSRDGRIVFKLPPGPYLVRVAGEADPADAARPGARQPTAVYRIEQSSRPTWLPFLAGVLGLAVLNLFGVFGAADAETRRWADSQFGTPPGRPPAS